MAHFAASSDDPSTNREFAESLGLDYPILSDPDKETARAYGVLNVGGEYCDRNTVYIGKDGKILHVDRDVNVKSAGADIAARLEALGVPRRSP